MSFLAPFFVLGALTISLPIVFHLIRRSPRGRVPFSSLMFLSASPPRITRRSRLDNWLLLLLRAAALILLAIAFARPFLREATSLDATAGRQRAIVVDVSASMRRGELWTKAKAEVEKLIEEAEPGDRLALFAYHDGVQPLFGFEDSVGLPLEQVRAQLRSQLERLTPSWGGSDLGAALVAVSDTLMVVRDRDSEEETPLVHGNLEIVVVTDLQEGNDLSALEEYEWPERAFISLRPVAEGDAGNARATVHDVEEGDDRTERRLLIQNAASSAAESFSLFWANETQREAAQRDIYVPAGEQRIVTVAPPPSGWLPDRLVLEGDAESFDNVFYLVPPRRQRVRVDYLGRDAAADATGLRYYLERALGSDATREVEFVATAPDGVLPPQVEGEGSDALLVVSEAIEGSLANSVRRRVLRGGTALVVLTNVEQAPTLAALLGVESIRLEEVTAKKYSMLSDVQIAHPVFQSFTDPRFSDFTKIRFWRHRRLLDAAALEGGNALARFDNGDPALLEFLQGSGRVFVLASGWAPYDSQLALSTKFVPLVSSLLEPRGQSVGRSSFDVHDVVPLAESADVAAVDGDADAVAGAERRGGTDPDAATNADADSGDDSSVTPEADTSDEQKISASEAEPDEPPSVTRRVQKPDGTHVELDPDATEFAGTDEPGVYSLQVGERTSLFAVNIPESESQTVPLESEAFELRGVRFEPTEAEDAERQKLVDVELEASQKLWRWLIVAALVLLIIETWLAGRTTRAALAKESS